MSKPKLLIADSGLDRLWLMRMLNQFFDCEIYDPNQRYDQSTVVMADNRFGETANYQTIKQRGYRMVLPYLMDSNVNDSCEIVNGDLTLRARDWMWIQESQQFRERNYHVPQTRARPDRFFLLLMHLRRDHREKLHSAVTHYLDCSLHSYVGRGIRLPGDTFEGAFDDRLYVPDWYSRTCFSLVSESYVTPELFISEKIFKPLAHQHAVVVYGTPGTLEYVRGAGFETFRHRIDESYDLELHPDMRLQKIMAVLEDLHSEFIQTGTVFQDPRTHEILAHNHARFFDQTEIESRFETQVVNPIREWAES